MEPSIRAKQRRRKTRNVLIAAGACAILAGCWFGGVFGRLLSQALLPALLPLKLGAGIEATSLASARSYSCPDRGAVLTVGAGRARRVIGDALPWKWLLPPGLIRDGMVLEGAWKPEDFPLPGDKPLPFAIAIVGETNARPKFQCRYPADEFDLLLKSQYGEETIRKTKKWILGTYELVYKLTFDTLRIRSDEPAGKDAAERNLAVGATGKVKIEFHDNLANAKATARVSKLAGRFVIRFPTDSGVARIQYDGFVDEIKADVDNMTPWLDHKLADDLREALQKSVNKEKTKRKIERIELPQWAPLDAAIDLRIGGPAALPESLDPEPPTAGP